MNSKLIITVENGLGEREEHLYKNYLGHKVTVQPGTGLTIITILLRAEQGE